MGADNLEDFRAAGNLQPAYQAVDWSRTPLGPPAHWSPALRAAVDTTLHSRFPVSLFWGPEFLLIYNEAYTRLIGDKHPSALGTPAHEVFEEAWHLIGPMMEEVLAGGPASWVQDAPVPLRRHGFLEECYFTFSYSPVHGPDGRVEGVIDIATETTTQVITARRQELLGQLAEQLGDIEDLTELADNTLAVLRTDAVDLPAVGLHLTDIHRSTTPRAQLPASPPRPLHKSRVLIDEHNGSTTVWLPLTGTTSDQLLVVRCSDSLPFDRSYRTFLRLLADIVGQALGRLTSRDAERVLHEQELRFSTTLQRSLLTRPTQPDHLQIAVRYEPATEAAQVGGDWHDSFVLPDGSLALAIGDVAGHDRDAAAAMAQVRNLLRGIAYTVEKPPAAVLTALDHALTGLDVHSIATAILARVEQPGQQPEEERPRDQQPGTQQPAMPKPRTLRWSNAGHPPPVMIEPDGHVELLTRSPDLLLGLDPDAERFDHTRRLEPGATVVFYTDGLIERRSHDLEEGLDWLISTLSRGAGEDPEQLADALLAQMPQGADDDVAILILKARPE